MLQPKLKVYLIIIHRLSLVKAAMNAHAHCKLRNGVKKRPSIAERWSVQSLDRRNYICKLRYEKKI